MGGPWRSLLIVAAVVAAVHGGALRAPFHYDDHHSLVDNPAVRDAANLPAFFIDPGLFSARPERAMYRPLVLVTYVLDHALGDGGPFVYHLTNLFLHLAAAAALLLFARDMAGEAAGLAAALLFALHPLAGEPAVYVSARSESLALILCLLSLWRLRRGGRIASALLYGGALLAKSTAIVLPGVAFCLQRAGCPGDASPGAASPGAASPGAASPGAASPGRGTGQGPRAASASQGTGPRSQGERPASAWVGPRALLPHLAVAGVYLVGIGQLLRHSLGEGRPRGLWQQLLTQLEAWPYIARLVVVPHPLSVEHPVGGTVALSVALVAAGLVGVSLAVCAMVLLPSRGRWLAAAALLPLLPASVVPLNAPVSEHRLYFTVALAALGVGVACGRRLLAPGWRRWSVAALLLVLAGLSHARLADWSSETRLWQAAVRVAPANARAHFFLADVYRRQGRGQAALDEYGRADSLSGGGLEIRLSRAGQLVALGQAAAARRLLEPMAEAHPDDPGVLYNLGLSLREADPARAEALFRLALEARPTLTGAAMELALCLEGQGELAAATGVLRGALDRAPGWAEGWVNLGFLWVQQGEPAAARRAWERALELDPTQTLARDNLRRLDDLERRNR